MSRPQAGGSSFLINDTSTPGLSNPVSKTIHNATNQQVEKHLKLLDIVLVKISPICVTLPMFIVSFLAYFITDMGADAFNLPFHMWFPFDTKNPFGYTIAVASEYILTAILLFTVSNGFGLIFGTCLTLVSLTKDIKYQVHTLNENARAKDDHFKIVKQFSQVIDIHSDAKQSIADYSEVSWSIFLLLFVWSTATIASTMLLMQMGISQSENNYNLVIIVILFAEMFWSLALVFIVCFAGQAMSDAFEGIEHEISQLNWYQFPFGMWQSLSILLVGSQQTAHVVVFGSISCDREAFKKIANRTYSLFMVLRKFEF